MHVLDDWQKEILEYEGHIGFAKGRRIGATHIMAMKAVEHLMKHKNHHPKSQIVCVSLTEDQAKLIIAFALDYASEKYKSFIGRGQDKPTQLQLTMVVRGNRRILLARPVGTTGDAARGFDGQVLMVDEAPRMSAAFFNSATPILATNNGKIWMWGTFEGEEGFFWDRYNEAVNQNKPTRFKFWCKTTEDVFYNRPISASWTEEQKAGAIQFLADEKREKSAMQYGEEYMAIPSSNLHRFFNKEWIDKVCTGKRNTERREGKHYLGVDIARMGGDENAYQVILDDGTKVFKHVESLTERYKLTTETERNIIAQTKIWNARKVGIDAGSGTLGVSILDHLRETDIKHKVEPMNNREVIIETEGDKDIGQHIFMQDMYYNLKSMGEHGEIILLDDENVRLSLSSIRMDLYTAPNGQSKIKISGTYAHIVEGLIRAAWLARKCKTLNLWIA